MKTTIIFITMVSCCQTYLMFRLKRDNGGAFDGSGGPLAASSQNQIPSGHHPRPKATSDKHSLPCRYGAARKSKNRQKRSIETPHAPNSPLTTTVSYSTTSHLTTTAASNHSDNSSNSNHTDNASNSPNNSSKGSNSSDDEPYSKFVENYPSKSKNKNLSEEQRKNIATNLNVIERLKTYTSSKHSSASYGVTKYADVSFEKFSKLGGTLSFCGHVNKVKATARMKMLRKTCAKFNWADYGVIPDVREQNECGSCYAMSTVDLISSQNSIENKGWKKSVSLSPQYIIDCLKAPGALGCEGGRPKEVIAQLAGSDPRLKYPLEKCYPYKDAEQKTCPNKNACPNAPEIPLNYAEVVDATGEDEMDIMASMLQWGPLVAVVGLTPAWQFYNGGVITEDLCDEMGNHAVLVTGYDFNANPPYYIIKNSWGADWGDKGYVKIEAGKNVCDIGRNVLILCTKHCNRNTNVQQLIEQSNNPDCRVRNITTGR